MIVPVAEKNKITFENLLRNMQKKILPFILETVIDLAIIGLLVVLIRSFIASPFQVHGSSMCPTFNYENGICETDYGEYLIISKFKYLFGNPQRGDIVVFEPPNQPKGSAQEFFIKRVIGLPGETVEISNGKVYINGKKLDEPYLKGKETFPASGTSQKYEVPEEKYFVMGDNRDHSIDSRWCFRDSIIGGCKGGKTAYLTKDIIQGRSWIILYPFSKMGLIPAEDYKFQ